MRKRPLCFICLIVVTLQAIRIMLSGAEVDKYSALAEALINSDSTRNLVVEGTVKEIHESENLTTVYLKNNQVYSADAGIKKQQYLENNLAICLKPKQKIHYKKETTKYDISQIKIGNKLSVKGTAELFEKARNPGNFNQRQYYSIRQVYVKVWADEAILIDDDWNLFAQKMHLLRKRWSESLIRCMGDYYGGTMSAILIGQKSELDPEMKKMYQKNGIGHVLAISGLHMSFIGIGIYNLFRKCGAGFLLSAFTGSFLLICYTVLVGTGVSSMRALLMFLVKMGAEVIGRDYDLPTSLGISAAIICTNQPMYLLDAGFQLSFGAICGISLLTPIFQEMLGEKIQGNWILKGLAGSLAVNVFLLGPMLYFYFELPLYSVFLNLFILTIVPLVMGSGIFGSLFLLFWLQGGKVILKVGACTLWMFDQLCLLTEKIPGFRIVTGKPKAAMLMSYYLIVCALCFLFYRMKEKDRKRRLVGVGIITVGLIMIFIVKLQNQVRDEIRVTVLDVGQGDGICIESEHGIYFVDGGSSDVSKVGSYRIEPYLLSRGIAEIDYAFISHGDEDHCNGIEELLSDQKRGVRIKNLVLPLEQYQDETLKQLLLLAKKNETRVVVMEEGNKIENREKDFYIRCLAPGKEDSLAPGNEASMVLELNYKNFDMILTGDVEKKGEELLVSSGRLKKYDILKCAHHGSKNSGSEDFLKQTDPLVAIISAGQKNKYGHPHKETLNRLEKREIGIYSTQKSGAISIHTDGKKIRIESFLE